MYSLTSTKLTGNPGTSGWVQIHDFKPADSISKKGQLFVIIAVENSSDVESILTGREIAAKINTDYYKNEELPPFSSLQDTVNRVVKEYNAKFKKLEIAAVSFTGDVLFVVVYGGGSAILYRDGMLARILAGSEELTSASGYPKENDIFILATNEFSKIYSEGVLRASLEGGDAEKVVEQLAPSVHANPNACRIGAVFLSTGKIINTSENDMPEVQRRDGGPIVSQEAVGQREPEVVSQETESYTPSDIKSSITFREKLVNRLDSLISKFPNRRFYVKNSMDNLEDNKKRKTALTAGVILLVLLMISIFFGVKERNEKVKIAKYEPRLISAQNSINEALNVVTVDIERSRQLFIEGKKTVDELKSEGVEDERLVKLQETIDQNTGLILGVYEDTPELYVDLTLVAEGFKGTDLASSGNEFIAFDTNSKKIVKVDVETKKSLPIAGPEKVGDATEASYYSGRTFVLQDDGISEIEGKDNIIEKGWGDNADIHSYTANMYVLDKDNSEVYRYAGVSDGFGSQSKWLAEGNDVSFTDVVSWSIDGSVWMVGKTGTVYKFTQGRQDFVKKVTVEPELKNPTAIFVNEDGEYVYILESVSGRLIILDKTGSFIAQYKAEELKKGVDVVAYEDFDKMIVLTGEGKLFSLEIKHKKINESN